MLRLGADAEVIEPHALRECLRASACWRYSAGKTAHRVSDPHLATDSTSAAQRLLSVTPAPPMHGYGHIGHQGDRVMGCDDRYRRYSGPIVLLT
jgi:hypothetical protein